MKNSTLFLFQFLLFFCEISSAQIYSNGTITTGATSVSGVAAPVGYTWSELQNNTGNTSQANATAGLPAYYFNSGTTSYSLADNFTVPANEQWQITSFDFLGYQASYSGSTPPINQLRIRIYNGDPSAGGTIVAGNLTANVYDAANSGEAFIYRIFNSLYPAPGQVTNTTRKVWRVRGNISATLQPGNYWVEFQAHATNDTFFLVPPLTVVGVRGLPSWNSKINVIASTFPGDVLGWGINSDSGIPDTAPNVALDIPFQVNGTIVALGTNQNELESSVSLFPNPVKDYLQIIIKNGLQLKSIELFDIHSRQVLFMNSFQSADFQINTESLSKGVYLMKINTDSGSVTKKIIKN